MPDQDVWGWCWGRTVHFFSLHTTCGEVTNSQASFVDFNQSESCCIQEVCQWGILIFPWLGGKLSHQVSEEGGRSLGDMGGDFHQKKKVENAWPTWGSLESLAHLLTLPDIYLSVIIQHCFWRLLNPGNLVVAAKGNKNPKQDEIRVRLPPHTSVGEKTVLHPFWILSPILFSTSFWINSAICSRMLSLVEYRSNATTLPQREYLLEKSLDYGGMPRVVVDRRRMLVACSPWFQLLAPCVQGKDSPTTYHSPQGYPRVAEILPHRHCGNHCWNSYYSTAFCDAEKWSNKQRDKRSMSKGQCSQLRTHQLWHTLS